MVDITTIGEPINSTNPFYSMLNFLKDVSGGYFGIYFMVFIGLMTFFISYRTGTKPLQSIVVSFYVTTVTSIIVLLPMNLTDWATIGMLLAFGGPVVLLIYLGGRN
jgi:hypothetical protein